MGQRSGCVNGVIDTFAAEAKKFSGRMARRVLIGGQILIPHMTDHLWNRFSTFDNFLLAWQRIVNVSSRMVNDTLSMELFAFNLHDSLRELVRLVAAEDFPYKPLPDHKVYLPKPSSTLRTMSLLAVPDVVVYQAIVNVIADTANSQLVSHENQHIWGNLYAGPEKRWMLKPWRDQYNQFVKHIEKLFYLGNSWVASTDIVAFYDTVDHEQLIALIRRYCGHDERFEELLRSCLSKWSAHSPQTVMSRGIPQGSNASDFLANLYLHEVDREMIVHGYHYTRYVDDVRILGIDKATVQRGLIQFDLGLKRIGLVAQVSKTSVHQISDIEEEVLRLKFSVTDPHGTGEYVLVSVPVPIKTEDTIQKLIKSTPSEHVFVESNQTQSEVDSEETDEDNRDHEADIDENTTQNLQIQIRKLFEEMYKLLDDPDRGKEADTTITFCLNRLDPHESVRDCALTLLERMPWRSEAVTRFLGQFKDDQAVVKGLKEFIASHDVYSYHRANALSALSKVSGSRNVAEICRQWLADRHLDWYARTIAAQILADVPSQHSFFIECLKQEQELVGDSPEETAVLRQQLAFGAFQRISSKEKQLVVFSLACKDPSPLLRKLAVYLLQQPSCLVEWNDLKEFHQNMADNAELVRALGISLDAPRPCFIARIMEQMYRVTLSVSDLRSFYKLHYTKTIEPLRKSVAEFHESPSNYVRNLHQFVHLSIIAFYEYVFPNETSLFESKYAQLVARSGFKERVGFEQTWLEIGSLRNRVDHPIDYRTKAHSQPITVKEVEDIRKALIPAFQKFFDVWLSSIPLQIVPSSPYAGTS
jgi:retron-type reverse transcriptase